MPGRIQEGAFGSGMFSPSYPLITGKKSGFFPWPSGVGFGTAEDHLDFPSVRLPAPGAAVAKAISPIVKRQGADNSHPMGRVEPTLVNLSAVAKRDLAHPIPGIGRRFQKWWNSLAMYAPGNSAAPSVFGRWLPNGRVLKANGKKYVVPMGPHSIQGGGPWPINIPPIWKNGDPSGPPTQAKSIVSQNIWTAQING